MEASNHIIYFDNNATTKIDPRVLDAMMPYLTDQYANASSSHHFGLKSNKAIIDARDKVAELINALPTEIVFTSGATESLNLALKGAAFANQLKGRHIITLATEHKAVLDACKYLETVGFTVSYLPVKKDGLLDLTVLQNAIQPDTILVAVMYSNNETGVIQPIREIANLAHNAGALFVCDATQAVGKVPIDLIDLPIDLMAFSGHKFYAPKGIGALYIRKNRIKIEPLLHGGGHEFGFRSGTLNALGIVGIGEACRMAMEEMQTNTTKVTLLRTKLENELLRLPGAFVNGNNAQRMFNVSNICFPGIDATVLIGRMKNIAVSNGSACSSAIVEPSHVLKALGLTDDEAMASLRFSLGKFNTEDEVDLVVNKINELVSQPPLKYA
jgi:cysteine desulfurase